MHRFFIKDSVANLNDGLQIQIIENDDVKHIIKVLRLSAGEQIEIVDLDSKLFICEITKVDTQVIICNVISQLEDTGESAINISLYQGMPKGEKFDLIIQKAIELGVTRIVPVLFERCVVKLKDEKSLLKKHIRWNRIAYEAAKQSKRCFVPKVEMPITIDELIDEINNENLSNLSSNSLNMMFYEQENSVGLKNEISCCDNICSVSIVVGAEGGLEPFEVQKLKNAGVKSISLGKRILRTETAGIVTVALIQYELGDLGYA